MGTASLFSGAVTTPRWLSPAEQRAWRAYLEATVLLFDALDRQLQRDAGMPHAYYEILVRLSRPLSARCG